MKKSLIMASVIALCTLISSCEKDPCEGIICENGGNCVSGMCDCPNNYEGAFCQDQKTPSSIEVSNLRVLAFPSVTSGGGNWDWDGGPDVYFQVYEGQTLVYDEMTFIENANSSSTNSFDFNYTLNNPTSKYTIMLMDYDPLETDDMMGGIEFTPYHSSNEFPSVLVLEIPGYRMELNISYNF